MTDRPPPQDREGDRDATPPRDRQPYEKPILRELGTLSTMIQGAGGSRFDLANPTSGRP